MTDKSLSCHPKALFILLDRNQPLLLISYRSAIDLAIMDMNRASETFIKMPPYILTLLKSTEPYLDQYFAFDFENTFVDAGFSIPNITVNSPRHRSIIARSC